MSVQPALTPEEWARKELRYENWGEAFLAPDGDLGIRGVNNTAIFEPPMQHALAALALHGQPFGFTREDVRLLRTIAEVSDLIPRVASLADRIEALLPPTP